MKPRDMHSKKTHSMIGVGAALLGVALGIGVVYWDGMDDRQPVHAQGGGSCQQQETACMSKQGATHESCHPIWVQCMQKCMVGGGAVGQCNQDPECQASCTESATSQGGKISCCEGGPKHGNACKDKVDGQCNPKQTELGKEGMMPMMMPMMGGMPPMLPMPMPKMSMPMPMPPQEECQKEPKPEHCKSNVSEGLFSSLIPDSVKNLFSSDSSGENGQQSPLSKLTSLFTGGSANTNTTEINNPTNAVVTPVVSGSNAGGLSAQSGSQASGGNTGSQAPNINSVVTGFGSGGANADTSTGPIVSSINYVVGRIQNILSSLGW